MVNAENTMPNMTGTIIDDGRLQLLNKLGSGAYGAVYRAIDNSAPEPEYFAVKCLHLPKPGSRQAKFQMREFALHATVDDHPNVLSIHDVMSDELYIYVVLDLCSGGDLFGAIAERRVFHKNVELVRRSFIQLVDAVHHCHERGVFHRDIKPDNILCSRDGTNILLADFGLATSTRVSREFGCGSSFYKSPECIGEEINLGVYSTRHSDIWALGVILVNMVTGRNPWLYATTEDPCFSAYLHDPDFFRSMLPISSGMNTLLKRMLALNPLCRITLPELREEILRMETFLMTDEELENAPENVKWAAASYATRTRTSAPQARTESTFFGDSDSAGYSNGSIPSLDSEEIYTYPSPSASVDIGLWNQPSSLYEPNTLSLVDQLSRSSSSGDISDGPITPETCPTYPEVEVPDFAEGENMGEIQKTPKIVDEVPKTQKKSFWSAFGRLKGLTPLK